MNRHLLRIVTALLCVLAAGCVNARVSAVNGPRPSERGSAVDHPPALTPRGSTISFLRFDDTVDEDGRRVFEVQVEACVPQEATEDGTFSPRYFRVVLPTGRTVGPSVAAARNRPVVRTARVFRGSCVRGWVPFVMQADASPAYLEVAGLRGARWPIAGS